MSYNLPRILNNLSYEINNRDELTFINGNELHKIPIDNTIKIYSKNDSNIYKLDDNGIETALGSGGGVGGGDVYGPNSCVDNSVVFFDDFGKIHKRKYRHKISNWILNNTRYRN